MGSLHGVAFSCMVYHNYKGYKQILNAEPLAYALRKYLQNGLTALMWAVKGARPASIQLLLAKNADVEAMNEVTKDLSRQVTC